jgi:hypothetical protein
MVAAELQELYNRQARPIDELETSETATASALREISARAANVVRRQRRLVAD